jgi:N utilization substance protein A
MSRDFVGALLQLNAEKQVPREQLIRTVEEAIQSAYRRVGGDEDIHVRIDEETGKIRVFRARTVVAEIEDELTEFTVDEAHKYDSTAKVGDLIEYEQLDADAFGRIHAQTAKQVVLQRLREAERDVVFDQFADREGELITGTVNRAEPRAIIIDVGKGVEAILATTEQSPLEHYRIGQNVKAFVLEVRRATRGPQIYVSRTHKGFIRRLFELEVPEIHAGTVEVKAIAREAGSRSKVAVASRLEGLDPVGATVGQRGARVQAVVAELGGEKIDVIPWSDDPAVFVANALSPAQVLSVDIDEEHRIANVTVPERMLSLAIGREGQNARLAARLTGWRIDIRSDSPSTDGRDARPGRGTAEVETEGAATESPTDGAAPPAEDEPIDAKLAPAGALVADVPGNEAAAAADEAVAPADAAAPPDDPAPAAKPRRATRAKKAAAPTEPAEAPTEPAEAPAEPAVAGVADDGEVSP